jgi:YVTN family beta-propeller protein
MRARHVFLPAIVLGLSCVVVQAVSAAANRIETAAVVLAPHGATTTTVGAATSSRAGGPSDLGRLTLIHTIGGNISPKSVDASGTGLVFAQNMMYRHTMTVYNSNGQLLRTIPDGVNMAQFGFPGHPGITRGAPVEAAFSTGARYAYVSNYSMYGSGFGPEGSDTCTPASAEAAGDTNSYVYRVDTRTLAIDQVIQVGLVPKYVAVSPNGRYVLAANWCSFNLSIIDAATHRVVRTLPMGAYPRGIAITKNSSSAYVAIMGGDDVVKINLKTLSIDGSIFVGDNPRSIVLSPDGHYIYASLNQPGEVVKLDLSSNRVVASVHTGNDCRSLAISSDGTSLYVVNYLSDTMTMLRASDLAVLQTVQTGVNPVGVTYDPTTGDVWVAVYQGEILVYSSR